MPLRTLLGYEPSEARRYDDHGGSFMSFTPARSVTATRKAKYQAPMGRLKKLPPIDEENTPASTPRIRLNHEATQPTMARLPKRTFLPSERDLDFETPSRARPVLSVKPTRRERLMDPADDPKYDFDKPEKKSRRYVFKPDTRTYPKSSPREVNHTLVDGIVADYLHYARYGNVIPIYEGTSSSACPCCTDRNKENVRTLLGLPTQNTKPAPKKYDKQSTLNDLRESEDLDEDAKQFPNSLYSLEKKRTKKMQSLTPEEKQRQRLAKESQKLPWMNYQPLPHASNYLNAEFGRPSLTADLVAAEAGRAQRATATTVVEANSNYDTAMNKLETLTFGSGSYTSYQDYQ